MSWNIQTPGDYINGPLTVVGTAQFNSSVGVGIAPSAYRFRVLAQFGSALGGAYIEAGEFNQKTLVINNTNPGVAANLFEVQKNGTAQFVVDANGNLSFGNAKYIGWGNLDTMILGDSASNYIYFRTNATERVRIDGAGNTGFGTTSPLARLHSSNGQSVDSGLFNGLVIGGTSSSSARTASFIKNTSSPYDLIVRTQDFSGTTTGSLIVQNGSTEVGRINANGVYVLPGGAVGANGIGVAFPAAQSASTDANTLDDYEEGTWTPVFSPASGSFTTITPVVSGRYRKIGNTVFIFGQVQTTGTVNLGTASGILYIAGLPFTASSDGGYGQCSIFQWLNLSASTQSLGIVVSTSNSRFYFTKNSSNTSVGYVNATELGTAGGSFDNLIGFFGMYTV